MHGETKKIVPGMICWIMDKYICDIM